MLLTIVQFRSKSEMSKIGSRYDRWLQIITDDLICRISSGILNFVRGINKRVNEKKIFKFMWVNFWKDRAGSFENKYEGTWKKKNNTAELKRKDPHKSKVMSKADAFWKIIIGYI